MTGVKPVRPRDLIITIREDERGNYHYDLSRVLSADALFRRDGQSAEKAVGDRDGGASEINLEILTQEATRPPPRKTNRA